MLVSVKLLISFTAGIFLGAVYFGGLWLTVRRLPDSGRPFVSMFWSFLLRAFMILAGFYFVMGNRWDHLLAVLLGFLLTRELLVRRIGRCTS